MNSFSEGDLGYLAGLIDGEGSLYYVLYGKGCVSCSVRIATTSISLINYLMSHFGGHFSKSARSGTWKDLYTWMLTSKPEVKLILNLVVDRLVIKRKPAVVLLKFLNNEKLSNKYFHVPDDVVEGREAFSRLFKESRVDDSVLGFTKLKLDTEVKGEWV